MTAAPSQTPEAAGLEPCPFCGGEAEIEQFGNTCRSTIYCCQECGCKLETGEEFYHGRAWNRRVTAASAQAAIDAEKARADRLAKALERARLFVDACVEAAELTPEGGEDPTDLIDAIDTALQQETQP